MTGTPPAKDAGMNTSRPRSHPRLRRRQLTTIATLVLTLTLALGGVAMAATGYSHVLRAANAVAPQPAPTITVSPGAWQSPGCVFPAASAFAER